MATQWPSTLPNPSYGLDEEFYKPQNLTEFEANYIQASPAALRGRKAWPNLGWKILTEAEYQILEAFFDDNQGNYFEFTHPVTGVVHDCVFTTDRIKCRHDIDGHRNNVQCPIMEM